MVQDISCNRCRGTGKEPIQSKGTNIECKACGGTGRGQSSAIGDTND